MNKNTYLNNAIIGNGKVTAGLDERGRLLRMYYPLPDSFHMLEELEVAFNIEGIDKNVLFICGSSQAVYNQDYVQSTAILKTDMYLSDEKLKIEQTDFAPVTENMYIRYFEITNEGDEVKIIKPLVHSSLSKEMRHGSSSRIMQNSLCLYNRQYTVSIFSKDDIESYKVNDCNYERNTRQIFEDYTGIENEYIGMSYGSTIEFKKITIFPGETKIIPIYISFFRNKALRSKTLFDLEMEIIRIKKINVKDREAETKRYWESFVRKCIKHDLSKLEPKMKEVYIRSIVLLKLLRVEETGAVLAAFELDEEKQQSGGYGYVWPRDMYYPLKAFDILGLNKYVDRYISSFMKITQSRNGMWEQRFYTNGNLAPSWGYQIDETCTNILIVYEHYLKTGDIEKLKEVQGILQSAYKYILEHVRKVLSFKNTKTFDLWENVQDESIYGMGAVFASLEAMKKIYEELRNQYKENRLKVEQINKEIRKITPVIVDVKEWIYINLYSNEKNAFVSSKSKPNIDISALSLVVPFNIFTPNEKKMKNTIIAIDMALKTYTGGYLRYENDHYMGGKNAWSLANLKMAEYLISIRKL